jgi:sporulation protein YlmC with PRC-barrel domain
MTDDTHMDEHDSDHDGARLGAEARARRERQDGDHLYAMRDLVDMQLVTADGKRIGRVADVDCEWRADGTLALLCLRTGPQALARRFGALPGRVARFVFRDRFERRIALDEIVEVGLEVRLRGRAEDYAVGQSERWLVAHVLRFIPGSGT